MNRRVVNHEGQGKLFRHEGGFSTTPDYPDGPAVSIEFRARNLLAVINKHAEICKLEGFAGQADTPKIREKYPWTAIHNAQRKQQRLEVEIQEIFSRAYGLAELSRSLPKNESALDYYYHCRESRLDFIEEVRAVGRKDARAHFGEQSECFSLSQETEVV